MEAIEDSAIAPCPSEWDRIFHTKKYKVEKGTSPRKAIEAILKMTETTVAELLHLFLTEG